jgi:hypothetical protein
LLLTYTRIYEIPINPTPNNNKYPAAFTKAEIKKSTAITGFLEVITKIPDKIAPAANTSNKKLFIIFVFVFNCAYAFAFLTPRKNKTPLGFLFSYLP